MKHWAMTAGLVVSFGAPGCYSGLSNDGGDDDPADTDAGLDGSGGAGSGSEGSGTDTDDAPPGSSDCDPSGFGASPMARLTRDEYARAVRDLFEVTVDVSTLPGDERLGPFSVNLRNSVTTPAVVAYRKTAESVAAAVELPELLPCSDSDDCARTFIETAGRRAYRRPLSTQESGRLFAVFEEGRDSTDFEYGTRLAIQAILQNPNFLYRLELGDGEPGSDEALELTEYEVATRLSFLLWGTIPDEALLRAAEDGALETADGRYEQARQMLADPRAREGVGRIYGQMFGAQGASTLERDPTLFSGFTAAVARDMEREVESIAAELVLDESATLATLLTSRRSRVTPELAAFYGVELPPGATPGADGLFAVELPQGERGGLLTRAGVMANLSHETQTAPIKRANFVFEAIACIETPNPPSDVDDSPPAIDPDATGRELLDQKTADAACQGCHSFLNPVAFSFEHYDASGAYRTQEGNLPVDASGELVGLDVSGSFSGAVELSELLADSDNVRGCVVGKHASLALLRDMQESEEDACMVEELTASFEESGGDLRALLLALVARDSFAKRKVADPISAEED